MYKLKPRRRFLGNNVYAYVANDPLNFTDASGLCKTVNGVIEECEVVVRVPDPNSTHPTYPYTEKAWGSMTAQEQAPLRSMYDQIATVGQSIQNTGGADEQAAWSGVESIMLAPQESPVDSTGSNTLATNLDVGRGNSQLTFFAPAIAKPPDIQRFITGHEVFHGVGTHRTEARNVEAMPAGPARDAARLLMEQRVDAAAIGFLRPRGLVGAQVCVSAYSGCL